MNNRGFTLLELVIVVAIIGILAAAVLPLARWSVKRQNEYQLQQNLRILRNAIDHYHDMALAGLIEIPLGGDGYPPDLESLVEGVALTGEMPSPVPGVSDAYSATGRGLTGGFAALSGSGGGPQTGAGALGNRGGAGFGAQRQGSLGTALGQTQDPTNPLSQRLSPGQRNNLNQLGQSLQARAGGRGGFGSTARQGRRSGGDAAEKMVFLRRIPVDPFTSTTDWGLRCYGEGLSDRSWCGRNVFDVYTKARGTGMDGRAYRTW